VVPIDQPGDVPLALFYANTLADLHRLEGSRAP
jgi:molybdopterin-guanine dinucleotide biosynthesis protein A